ncbi:serine/threonine dehydratase [Spirilliplanes yamanashiensis]|uniref:Serine/threonine dehydratase n=1 Tax=Spirilliplanes yamanashiensis TaxID=42233 RepID=A0A8J3YB09_9ACTN|nr:serine/threonine dehydratase [Spirilliplanes yamanashiensis]MDP9817875.1 threonine dehydratase [Spirilliplanes yamanashiensis]GIJ04685.1 serine/threonine dehydratase [Spirilliplanes yamanashiensis]
MITRADVDAAAARTAGRLRRTPVLEAGDTWLKLEFLQHTGTFKARGAMNRLLGARERGELDPAVGVVVASGGNAGLANAWAAAELGVPATVFVPAAAPQVKVDLLRAYGATVVQGGAEYAAAHDAAVAHVARTGAVYCHAYDQPEIAAGAGTAGRELLEQTGGAVGTVLVAVGGGGLMAGVAAAVEGAAAVVAVEPAGCPTLHAALAAGEPVDVPVSGVAADSLGARRAGAVAFAVAVRTGVRSVLVSDDDLVAARRDLWRRWRIVVEHGAAAAWAALLTGAYVPAAGERVAVLLCGANTDPAGLDLRR